MKRSFVILFLLSFAFSCNKSDDTSLPTVPDPPVEGFENEGTDTEEFDNQEESTEFDGYAIYQGNSVELGKVLKYEDTESLYETFGQFVNPAKSSGEQFFIPLNVKYVTETNKLNGEKTVVFVDDLVRPTEFYTLNTGSNIIDNYVYRVSYNQENTVITKDSLLSNGSQVTVSEQILESLNFNSSVAKQTPTPKRGLELDCASPFSSLNDSNDDDETEYCKFIRNWLGKSREIAEDSDKFNKAVGIVIQGFMLFFENKICMDSNEDKSISSKNIACEDYTRQPNDYDLESFLKFFNFTLSNQTTQYLSTCGGGNCDPRGWTVTFLVNDIPTQAVPPGSAISVRVPYGIVSWNTTRGLYSGTVTFTAESPIQDYSDSVLQCCNISGKNGNVTISSGSIYY